MSKTLDEVTLLELLPPNLRGDPDIIAASAAADASFKELVGTIAKVLTIADIDNASSEVVDALAVEMRCDFYDQSLPLDNRRKLVKNAYLYKFLKGTPFVVQGVVSDAFSNAMVREWFQYNGEPYHFRVITDDDLEDKAVSVIEAINSVKNVRSYFDGISAVNKAPFTEYVGFAVRTAKKQTIDGMKLPPQIPYKGLTLSIFGVVYDMQ
jgi:P2-related tail formation protein